MPHGLTNPIGGADATIRTTAFLARFVDSCGGAAARIRRLTARHGRYGVDNQVRIDGVVGRLWP